MTLEQKIQLLEIALRRAIWLIPAEQRCRKRFIHVDEAAGSTYELELHPWIEEAAKLCGFDEDGLERLIG